ncbi:InlB B-repeat-containing protein [Allochromatium palmeri]|uniref:VWA domain-containing protein n=1 Tax=Allochromatium palmeri TaxID=231048 RepID=A0A6N8EJA2_9GAMM|nr:VWA domain-containing protein [Allochromatium palmeri]MTW22404.1 VWA domain-containing protein [Allochromatium palmeri]
MKKILDARKKGSYPETYRKKFHFRPLSNRRRMSVLALTFGFLVGASSALAQGFDAPSIVKGEIIPIPMLQRLPSDEALNQPNAVSLDVLAEDFESGATVWTTTGDWEIGAVASGPNTGGLGNSTQAAATILDGNYSNQANANLTSPSISLPSGVYDYSLEYSEWFETETVKDQGVTELSVDGGATWTLLSTINGSSEINGSIQWRTQQLPLDVADGSTIQIRFRFTSDTSDTSAGWYIDDLRVIASEADPIKVSLATLNAQEFPIVRAQVRLKDLGGNCPAPLTTSNFEIYEDDVLQTDLFEVTPPGGPSLADIVFLMDNSGSMSDEQAAVVANIEDFVDNLNIAGINAALGLTRYGQSTQSGDPILEDNGTLSTDTLYFKTNVLTRNISSGGTEPGYKAISDTASSFTFRPGSQRIFVEITDEKPNQGSGSGYVLQDAKDALTSADATLFALTSTYLFPTFEPLVQDPTTQVFDILEPFDRILKFIVSQVSDVYSLRYQTSNPVQDGVQRTVRIEATCGSDTGTVVGHYTPGAAPVITRTPATEALSDTAQQDSLDLPIIAEIADAKDPFVTGATLYYKGVNDASFTPVAMTQTNGDSTQGTWSGTIPAAAVQGPGIAYYLTATDGDLTTSSPRVNPSSDPYLIAVLPNVPPDLQHTPVTSAPVATEVAIAATASDTTTSLASVNLFYRVVGDSLYEHLAMTDQGGGQYQAAIPSATMGPNGAEYRIVATDDFGLASTVGTADQPLKIEAMSSLSVTVNGSGSVTSNPAGIDCGQDCTESYLGNADVTLTAIPISGAAFGGWGGDCAASGTDSTCTLTMETARTVSASFAQNAYGIQTTAVPNVGGQVTCNPNPVNSGQNSQCTATPNTGYGFTGWQGDCSGSNLSCTLSAVTSDKSVTGTFALNTYAIQTQADPAAGGQVVCAPNPVNHGDDILCTAAANAGYDFTGWGGDCSGTDLNCTLSAVIGGKSVIGRFMLQPTDFTIQTAAQPPAGGTVQCSPNPVPRGVDSTCTATPNSGYRFTGWSGDCSGTDLSCTLSAVASAKSVTGDFAEAGPAATHSFNGCYIPGALLTITNQFNDTSGDQAQSLTWDPLLPSGWTIVSVEGDGGPQVSANKIAFNGNLRQLPIEFSYRVSIPNDARGEQQIAAQSIYQSSSMLNPTHLLVEPDPLFICQGTIERHSADYKTPEWVIDEIEYSRVLAHWRAGAYHVDAQGVDGYGSGSGPTTTGDPHDADYQSPYWRIDTFEASRILAYWRAMAYHVEPDTLDGYAPGSRQMASQPLVVGADAPQATHTVSPSQYTSGNTLTITSTIGQNGDRPLISLIWLPKLPNDWTITAVSGQGGPELNTNRDQILFTSDDLSLPLTFSYTVQVPDTASGSQTLRADFQYWWNDPTMVDPATASLEPLMVSDSGGSTVGDCSRSELALNAPITSGTQTKRSEVGIRTTGMVTVASGATLDLTAPRLVFEPGFSVESGGRLTATSAPVICTAVSAQSASASNAIAPESVETFAPGFIASADTLPSWLLEHLAEFGIDADALTGGLLDTDERWLILETTQALHPEDGNEASDLYRLDLLTDHIALISVTEDGSAGNGASRDPAADTLGERVVFSSAASNLVPGDENGVSDLFLRDLVLGVTERLTQAEQASAHPAVDAEGTVLVYDQASLEGPRQILGQALNDSVAAEVVPLSEGHPLADAHHPAISADGRFLAYLRQSSDAQGTPDCTVEIRDFVTGLNHRQACPAALATATDQVRAAFSQDGRELHWHLSGQEQPVSVSNPLGD